MRRGKAKSRQQPAEVSMVHLFVQVIFIEHDVFTEPDIDQGIENMSRNKTTKPLLL